jgi:hypothetical protein
MCEEHNNLCDFLLLGDSTSMSEFFTSCVIFMQLKNAYVYVIVSFSKLCSTIYNSVNHLNRLLGAEELV